MRIVFDLQACQTPGSRTRGIGRYSLAHVRACARRAGEAQVLLLLNDRYPDTIAPIRAAFDGLVAAADIHVFSTVGGLADPGPANDWRHGVAQQLYQAHVAALKPDVFHATSLFEYYSEAVTGLQPLRHGLTSATLYDLIPLQYPDVYLAGEGVSHAYHRKLQAVCNADLLLAISDSSRREALDLLGLPSDRVVNIRSAVDEHFRVVDVPPERVRTLREKYGIAGSYILYTGGIDFRKNVEGLIEAYARLPEGLRLHHQLVVVCSIDDPSRARLMRLAGASGLQPDRLVLTGFVSEPDLVDLYNLAALFVFPSLHEGFGLPALEAMACGVPTLASNCSSLPEVVGLADALFDPRQPAAIALAMQHVLETPGAADRLRMHGLDQAQKFSWDATAGRTLEAFAAAHEHRSAQGRTSVALPGEGWPRPRLAYVSPLPPEQSGIADYSAVLLKGLARYYEIELVTPQREIGDPWLRANFPCRTPEWFDRHASRYQRVLYHFGNSEYHSHMFGLLERHPGTVVLHDFFLSGILAHLQLSGAAPEVFTHALYESHGYPALCCLHRDGVDAARERYPASLSVHANALGVIVHSRHSIELRERYYPWLQDVVTCLPMPRSQVVLMGREQARARLQVPQGVHLTASFGFVAATKCHHELVDAWLQARADDPLAWLVLVGRNDLGLYGTHLLDKIAASPARDRIRITGFVSADDYAAWLAAADLAVQLRTASRGETSAAVYDCLTSGLALICNADGSLAELPETVAWKLPARFEVAELASAMARLSTSPGIAGSFSAQARRYAEALSPYRVAAQFHAEIERNYRDHPALHQQALVERLRAVDSPPEGDGVWLELACAGARNLPSRRQPVCYIDLGDADEYGAQQVQHLAALLAAPPAGWRCEPVCRGEGGKWQVAHDLACRWLGLPARPPLPLLTLPGDAWLQVGGIAAPDSHHARLTRTARIDPAVLVQVDAERLARWLSGGRDVAMEEQRARATSLA